jgi:hypothetical protein
MNMLVASFRFAEPRGAKVGPEMVISETRSQSHWFGFSGTAVQAHVMSQFKAFALGFFS